MEVPVGTAGGNLRAAQRQDARRHRHRRPAPSWWPASACPAAPWSHLQPGQHSRQPALRRQQPAGRALYRRHRPALHGPAALRVQRLPVRPAAPVRRHAGSPDGQLGRRRRLAGSRLGSWDALIPPGAKFLTPSGQPKRLGDGFYEQKAVSDQILATTGQRFLEKYSDNDTQYKALLAAAQVRAGQRHQARRRADRSSSSAS